MKIYKSSQFAGLTPRLKEMVFGAVNSEPLPGTRTYEEKVEGLFRDKVVQREITPRGWELESVDYERTTKVVLLSLVASNDAYPPRKKEVKITKTLIPLTAPQAAAVGAETLEVYQPHVFGSGKMIKPPLVWWGTIDDLEEIQRDFPHLC